MADTSSLPSLTPAGFQVLLALETGHTHGYAVMRFVEEVTAGATRLGPGTLYRTLARLVADGLVTEAVDSDPGAVHDARRRYYRLTPEGRQAAKEELAMLVRLIDAAAESGLLPQRSAR